MSSRQVNSGWSAADASSPTPVILFLELGEADDSSALVTSLQQQSSHAWHHQTLSANASLAEVHKAQGEARANYVAIARSSTSFDSTAVSDLMNALTDPMPDLIYSDEILRDDGATERVHLKPAWSPERFEQQDYLGNGVWFSASTLQRLPASQPVSTVRSAAVGAAATIAHLPRVLANGVATRSSSPATSARDLPDTHRTSASIIIPTAGGRMSLNGQDRVLVQQAVESIVQLTAHQRFEVIVVQDRTCDDAVLAPLKRFSHVRIIKNQMPFNFSKACNLGAAHASGEVLVFVNDDTECLESEWLSTLLRYCIDPQIGAVGPQLLFEDRRLQHAGIWSRDGIPGHRYARLNPALTGVEDALLVTQNCLAVTGACLAVEARKFHSVGGFDGRFPANFNDVDLCLRLLGSGWRTVADRTKAFIHFESATRTPAAAPEEYELLERIWGRELRNDFWDHPGHTAPAPNEYPPPLPSFIASRQAAASRSTQLRVWDVVQGLPVRQLSTP